MDELQQVIARRVENGAGFGEIRELISGKPPRAWTPTEARPHLTESWFCCAEPTSTQRSILSGDAGPRRAG